MMKRFHLTSDFAEKMNSFFTSVFMLASRLFRKGDYLGNKILIDLTKIKNPYCGLGRISYSIGERLSVQPNAEDYIFLVPKKYNGFFGDRVSYVNYYSIALLLCIRDIKVWHTLYQLSRFKAGKGILNILTVHDLNFIFEKKTSNKVSRYLKRFTKDVQRADVLVYISNFTKDMTNRYVKIEESKKQVVIYNGVDISKDVPSERPHYLPSNHFLFSIGVVSFKKNFEVLIDFMKKIPPHLSLVIAGEASSPYAINMCNRIKNENLQNRIFMPGKISEEDRNYLYQNCEAFVFPSLYEGFGLPIIEAMRFGKPVFTTTSTSLPEIGGTSVFYWEHFDPDYMVNIFNKKMKFFKENKEFQSNQIAYSKTFNWDDKIQDYIALYQEFLHTDKP